MQARSAVLFPLFSSSSTLSGVGPALFKVLSAWVGTRVLDLLFHAPVSIIDRRAIPPLTQAQAGQIITAVVTAQYYDTPPKYSKRPIKIFCQNDTGELEIVYFNASASYVTKYFPIGVPVVVSGRVDRFTSTLQMAHPDYVGSISQLETIKKVGAVYPLTHGITLKTISKVISQALKLAPDLPEWIDHALLQQHGWPQWKQALQQLHQPATMDDVSLVSKPRERLAFDELFANQLTLGLSRRKFQANRGIAQQGNGKFRNALLASLPFKLTASQQKVTQAIIADMAAPKRMMRLLQGDVGSGKTLVALIAMLNAIESGHQAALMAPTELLARQHFINLNRMVKEADLAISIELFIGKDKAAERKEKLARLASGEVRLAIGTHALFQDEVMFQDLSLVVIDEQHRFGVKQRAELARKGKLADILYMTATPIPRTLTMTFYGDMEVSLLTEKPPGRTPIDTRVLPAERFEEVLERLKAVIETSKIYWICPLIDESEKSDLAAAEERFELFCQLFGKDKVGLIHGKMKPPAREQTMQNFAEGQIRLLVATTVIEVGVDVPDATIMVIEHAERFGLAQLHQLRGRVGRGALSSSCLLLYGTQLGETGRARLGILRETEDGFRIAEEDLLLRGSGDLLGLKQSGLPEFKFADLKAHGQLLLEARRKVQDILARNPHLEGQEGENLHLLLQLMAGA